LSAACLIAIAAGLAGAGCGTAAPAGPASPPPAQARAAERALLVDLARTRQVGRGAAFRPPPYGAAVAVAAQVGPLRCGRVGPHPYGAHLELFAAGRGVLVPAGIGIAPPQRRRRAVVIGGRCSYPLRTLEPSGVVEVDPVKGRRAPTLGELFAVWGQRLSARRLFGFTAAPGAGVVAYLDGRRWAGDPRAIRLRRHAQVVVELGPHVDPHPTYSFAPGL
jgi:hypothetical protein